MITFKYSIYWDIVWYARNRKNRAFLDKHNIKYIPFTLSQFLKNIFAQPKPNAPINTNSLNVICYWLSSGTWGAYTPPNKIFVCPKDIEKTGGLERVIRHEVTHLLYQNKTKDMTHEEKESVIRAHENNFVAQD